MLLQSFINEMESLKVNFYFYIKENGDVDLYLIDIPEKAYHKLLYKTYVEIEKFELDEELFKKENPKMKFPDKPADWYNDRFYKSYIKIIMKHTDCAFDASKNNKLNLVVHLDREHYLQKLCSVSHELRDAFFCEENNICNF